MPTRRRSTTLLIIGVLIAFVVILVLVIAALAVFVVQVEAAGFWLRGGRTVSNIEQSSIGKPFIELKSFQTKLQTWLIKSKRQVVWISGVSGAGKTRFVRQVLLGPGLGAKRVKWLVSAGTRQQMLEGMRELAIELHVANSATDLTEAAGRAREWLQSNHQWVLVVQHPHPSPRPELNITDLLPSKPYKGTVIVLTSRRQDDPSEIPLEVLNREERFEFLWNLVHQKVCNNQSIQKLSNVLDGLPLLLVQSAALVNTDTGPTCSELAEHFTEKTRKWRKWRFWRRGVPVPTDKLLSWLWEMQHQSLRVHGTVKLLQAMALFSPAGVQKELVQRLPIDNLTHSIDMLQKLELVEVVGSSYRLFRQSRAIALEKLKSEQQQLTEVATMTLRLLLPQKDEDDNRWWYPCSFYRVSDSVSEHLHSLVGTDSDLPSFLQQSRDPALKNLTCQARLALSGYAHHNLHDFTQSKDLMLMERKRSSGKTIQRWDNGYQILACNR